MMPRNTIQADLDPTGVVVLLKVESERGGFVAPLSPEEAHVIGNRLVSRALEAEHNKKIRAGK